MLRQIWFQNRRQSSRRKSRPLLPHEIAQYQLSRSVDTFVPLAGQSLSSQVEDDEAHDNEEEAAALSQVPFAATSSDGPDGKSHDGDELRSSQQEVAIVKPLISLTDRDVARPEQQLPSQSAKIAEMLSAELALSSQGGNTGLGYLANRRSQPSLLQSHDQSADGPAPASTHQRRSSASLRKTSSFVRLAMSVDGNASVTTKYGASPSPPRPSQGSQQPFIGSQGVSVPTSSADQAIEISAQSGLHRSASGRSRDYRAWEFWCDKDSRTELEEKAEKEGSGSAADAIGLLRSASGRSILGSISTKRNSILSRNPSSLKRSKINDKRPLLQRANTSFGRLQGEAYSDKQQPVKAPSKLKHSGSAVSVYVPGNDSDKENWSPDSDSASTGQPAVSFSTGGRASRGPRVLEDNNSSIHNARQSQQVRSLLKTSSTQVPDRENADPEADPELASFIRGGRKSTSVSEEDDLDCVQGLLSLSQGNWR